MAAIYQKDNGKYRVVYDNPDGISRRQLQKTFNTKKEALAFKKEVEHKAENKTLFVPKKKTVEAFFNEWVLLFARQAWTGKTFDTNIGLMNNHIIPYFGKKQMADVTPLDIERFIDFLKKKKISGIKTQGKSEDELPCLSGKTVRAIYFVLRQGFDKAVEWQIIEKNPVICMPPKRKKFRGRQIWDIETVILVLKDIKHKQLHLGVHFAFICSLRPGEIVGLTWDSINFNSGTIRIDKSLSRYSKKAIAELPGDEIIKIFPSKKPDAKSQLVLKLTKTEESERWFELPIPLLNEFKERKQLVDAQKEYLGAEYQDDNLVFCLEDGTPVSTHLMEKWFKKWQAATSLEVSELVMQELRHSSATYKVKIADGDFKAVQGDTGHSNLEVLLNTYAQIEDKNRLALMKNVAKEFYPYFDASENIDEEKIDIGVLGNFLLELKEKDPFLHKQVFDSIFAADAANN